MGSCFLLRMMGFENYFDNLIFKRLTVLRKGVQCVVDYFKTIVSGYMQS